MSRTAAETACLSTWSPCSSASAMLRRQTVWGTGPRAAQLASDRLGGRLPDRRDLGAAEDAHVAPEFSQALSGEAHAVRAGEDQPVVSPPLRPPHGPRPSPRRRHSIVGASMTSAPAPSAAGTIAGLLPLTSRRSFAEQRRDSNQFIVLRRLTTRPMIVSAGGTSLASTTFRGRSGSCRRRCAARGGAPADGGGGHVRPSVIDEVLADARQRLDAHVEGDAGELGEGGPVHVARTRRGAAGFGLSSLYSSSFSCPVIKVKALLRSRWVTGIPAYAAAAMAAVIQGTTSRGMSATGSISHSSPPRPKTNGSPPLRRTTLLAWLCEFDEQGVDFSCVEWGAAFCRHRCARPGDSGRAAQDGSSSRPTVPGLVQ